MFPFRSITTMAASTRFAASIRSLKRVSSVLEPSCCRLFSALTPAEAGRKAEAMAAAMDDDKAKPVTLATLTARAGIPKIPNAPMAPPLHSATTYTRPASGIYEESDTIYARSDNPTRLGLEKAMFELECVGLDFNLEDKNHLVEPTTFAFSSGMMAVTSIVLAHTSPVTVIVPKDIYHGVPTLLFNVFSRHNVTIRAVDMTQVSQVVDAISNASEDSEVIVWMETPSNPLCQIVDIQAICNATSSISSHKVTTVVDATMTSPVLTRPLEFGADISMHAATKYLGGHSDVLLGIATTSPVTERGKELAPILKSVQTDGGGVASPWDSWLTLRGLRTLQVRVERQCQTAQILAEFLDQHDLVSAVHYPGLPAHPQHGVAKRQMNGGFGGVFSVELETEVMATAFAGALKTIQRATSLGGTETLIEHRASIEPPGRVTSPEGLLRVSVGLEDPDDLIQDMEPALSIVRKILLDETI